MWARVRVHAMVRVTVNTRVENFLREEFSQWRIFPVKNFQSGEFSHLLLTTSKGVVMAAATAPDADPHSADCHGLICVVCVCVCE